MDSENKIYQIPEFTGEHIPVKEAARIMGKDIEYVRIGIIEGFLPIGTAFKKKRLKRLYLLHQSEKVLGVHRLCV